MHEWFYKIQSFFKKVKLITLKNNKNTRKENKFSASSIYLDQDDNQVIADNQVQFST
jgi:hypothetical protein